MTGARGSPVMNQTSGLQSQQMSQTDYLCRRCATSITRAEAGLFLLDMVEWLEDSLEAPYCKGDDWSFVSVSTTNDPVEPPHEVPWRSELPSVEDRPEFVRDGAGPSTPKRGDACSGPQWYGNYSHTNEPVSEPALNQCALLSRTPTSRGVLRGDGWYGLVGVETNPGPPKKHNRSLPKPAKTKAVIEVKRKKEKPSRGRSFGASIGGFVGDLAQKAIMKITGMGDYTVHTNSLYDGSINSTGPPQFASRAGRTPGSIIVSHREYIGDVISKGGSFTLNEFPITPTSRITFPWLSLCARNFEQYKFHGLVFEFKSNSATAVSSTNTALGAVILATQYNSLEPRFINKLQMDQYQFAVSTNPSISAIHPVECKPQAGAPEFLYLSENGSFAGDLRWNQLGRFSIATVGQQGSADINIGELWVSYDVELVKTRLTNSISSETFGIYWGRWMDTVGENLLSFQANDPWSATATRSRFSGPSTGLVRFLPNGYIHFAPGVVGDFELEISYYNQSGTPAGTPPRTWNVDTGAFSANVTYSPACYAYGPGAGSGFQSSSADAPITTLAQSWVRYVWQVAFRITYSNDTGIARITMATGTNFGICNISCTIRPVTWLAA